ncbi:MAG TPA: hypothetical protein VJ063_03010 [Verrucomicrobiae bacterium]|nr:hypothetical protein [Verrucomicrobiae bacterium]
MGFFSDAKDRMVESVALPMLNNAWLKPFGRATSLKIDSSNKTAEISLELNGEQTPLTIYVKDYELVNDPSGPSVVLKSVTTSRQWMTALAQEYLVGRRLAVPPEHAAMITRFL